MPFGLSLIKSGVSLTPQLIGFTKGTLMERTAIVAGTGFEGRGAIIKRHCKDEASILLKREVKNKSDTNAIAVYLQTFRLFGLLGHSFKKIGYIKANTAASLAKKMDSGEKITGVVSSYHTPPDRDHPRVTLKLTIEKLA